MGTNIDFSVYSRVPQWGFGWINVWIRNFLYFKATILASLFWACLEPLLYLVAVGYGLGGFVGNIDNQRYLDFFFPALLATTAMNISFFECTYASFTKLQHQKTFATLLMTRLNADEIALGEIFWGASKGFFSVCAVILVASFFGLIKSFSFFWTLPILAVTCWFFAAFGLLVTTLARNYDSFIYVISGLIVPMSLFSATYFPLARFPQQLRWVVYASPLTHVVLPVRELAGGNWSSLGYIQMALLVTAAFYLSIIATNRFRRKIFF